MFIRLFFCSLLTLFVFSADAQTKYPRGYFRWPLSLAPEIVANLGELRASHWHMGLDIRTAQKVNQRVYAAADGYIARIGVKPLGFGRFLVINHPNGFSTLYAHLNDFAPAIEAYVRSQQQQQESWEIELAPAPSLFPVKKGDFISFSGTTGGSQGPHVHFEIRDTKTDKCLNPLLFGMPLQDAVPPTVQRLALYDRSQSIYSGSPQFFGLKYAAGSYTLAGKENIIKTGLSRVSFAIQAYDRISGSNNQDGIYSAELFADNKPIVSFVMDSIDYTATAYMNAHIDYRLKYNGGAFFQHLSCLPGDMGGVYHTAYGDGTIVLDDTAVHHIRIEVKDAYGNSTSLRFGLQYDERLAKPAPAAGSGAVFVPGQVNILEKPGAEFYFPENNFYDTVYSFYQQRSLAGTYTVTDEHQLNDPSIPVHGSFQVRLRAQKNTIPDEWKNKLVMVRSYRSSHSVRKAAWQDGWVTASFGDFGHFQAFADLEPPAINELGKGDTIDLSPAKSIVLTPTDNYGIKSFRAELDGKWLRMTNDKGRSWVYIFDEQCPDGLHQLKVRIEDIVGNVTEKTWWFKKYPYTPPPVKKKAPVKKKTTTKKAPVRKK